MSSTVTAPERAPIPGGRDEVADSAVITIVHEAAIGCHAIVDLAPQAFGSSHIRTLEFGSKAQGVTVSIDITTQPIDVFVDIEYEAPISTVPSNGRQAVKFHVERVNLNVDRLHVSHPLLCTP